MAADKIQVFPYSKPKFWWEEFIAETIADINSRH